MIKVIIDSTCDIDSSYLTKYDVAVLPLSVIIEDKAYLDDIEISIDQVYAAMAKGIVPKTSQVRPGDAYQLFETYAQAGHDFIYLSFSKELSGTYATVAGVMAEVQAKYPKVKMAIVDSQGGSLATGIILLQLLSKIQTGCSFKQALALANEMAGHVEHRFLVADLNWLAKSGRINKAVAVTGRIMGVKPVLHVQEGKIKMLRIIRGSTRYLQHLANLIVEGCKEFSQQIIGISFADDEKIAHDLAHLIQERLQDCRIVITRIGSVLASHLGTGGVGAFFMKEKPSYYCLDIVNN